MFETLRQVWQGEIPEESLKRQLEEIRGRTPVPLIWLVGRTQSGKTSVIRYLTGAEDAEIGSGFQPCTKTSRRYDFPSTEAPLLSFIDTRGLDEPNYDPAEDIAAFNDSAHVVMVTVKAMDHAQENVHRYLTEIRKAKPERPVILVATCLHEAYPQQQHPVPYDQAAWDDLERTERTEDGRIPVPRPLAQSLLEQQKTFKGLYDYFVPLDLTRPEEGFEDPEYGGHRLKEVLIDALPAAYRQSLLTLDAATQELSDLYARHALPYIVGYSSLAATAGAVPVPFLDLFLIPGIQARMIQHLANLYGRPLTGERFLEISAALGIGFVVRRVARQFLKFIPVVGSIAGAAFAGAATFALGKAFCYYYQAVHKGQVPQPEELKRYYQEQLEQARQLWKRYVDNARENRAQPSAEDRS